MESRDHQIVINYKAGREEGQGRCVCKFVSESEEKGGDGGDGGDTHLTPGENVCFFIIKFFLPLVWRQIVFNLEI